MISKWINLLVYCAALLYLGAAHASSGDEAEKLVIGVRSEVRPFSYKLPEGTIDSDATRGPLGRAHYGGYMIRICDAVLAEMLVNREASPYLSMRQVKTYDIDEEYRKAEEAYRERQEVQARQEKQVEASDFYLGAPASTVEAGKPEDKDAPPRKPAAARFGDLGDKYDILCDPATIINSRRGVIVSSPLFLTGISYLTLRNAAPSSDGCGDPDPLPEKTKLPGNDERRPGRDRQVLGGGVGDSGMEEQAQKRDPKKTKPPKPALVGLVGGTTAQTHGLQALVDARELLEYEPKLVAELRAEPNKPACNEGTLVKSYLNYQDAAEAFCRGGAFHYYLGDLEMIRTSAGMIPGCKFDNGVVTYTNDRYGIFGQARGTKEENYASSPEIQERELLVARFFQILSQKVVFNPSILDKAYADTFPNQEQSRKLKLFYWAIRGDRRPDTELPPAQDSGTSGRQTTGSRPPQSGN